MINDSDRPTIVILIVGKVDDTKITIIIYRVSSCISMSFPKSISNLVYWRGERFTNNFYNFFCRSLKTRKYCVICRESQTKRTTRPASHRSIRVRGAPSRIRRRARTRTTTTAAVARALRALHLAPRIVAVRLRRRLPFQNYRFSTRICSPAITACNSSATSPV